MPLQDKETLITNEKRQMLGEPALFPLDSFVLSDQDILTSEFLKNDLEAVVQECTENGRFIVLNEMSVNAYAYSMEAANVVALSYGSLYHCLYAANLLMLSEEYYPEIGDVRACYSDVDAQDYPPSVGTGGVMKEMLESKVGRRFRTSIMTDEECKASYFIDLVLDKCQTEGETKAV